MTDDRLPPLPAWRQDEAPEAGPASAAESLVPEVTAMYARADVPRRTRVLQLLLRPVGPLALVGIAAGAFAALLPSSRWQGARVTPEAVADIGVDAVRELAVYLAQQSPELLIQLIEQFGRG